MVISIDKATAVRMYDKVQKHWKAYLADLRKTELPLADALTTGRRLESRISYMEETDMAVVVSQSAERDRGVPEEGAGHRPASQAHGARKTWRRSSRTPTIPSGSSSSAPCG